MALTTEQLNQMENLAKHVPANILIGAICIAEMQNVTDMVADFITDPDYVKEEGLPNASKMKAMAMTQIAEVLPATLLDSNDIDDISSGRDMTSSIGAIFRVYIEQIMVQCPHLMRVEYQPR